MHRFFVPPGVLAKENVTLSGDQAHQVHRVLRIQSGESVLLLDDTGTACEARLSGYDRLNRPSFEIVRRYPATGEPRSRITLYQAMLKGERFEFVLQKCTEVGVSAFVPVICQRSLLGDVAVIEQKRPRWERIIREAAEQSGRGRLPVLAQPLFFPSAVRALRHDDAAAGQNVLRLIPWEAEETSGIRRILGGCNLWMTTRIELFVGPEGGFTEGEITLAVEHGIWPVSLGPRILRAETAGLVAAAALLCEAGDMDPPATL